MSVGYTKIKLTKERIPMYHYDDRYYWSPACAECGIELTERTVAELEKAMAEHSCVEPG
jgi:hypothetical protein